MQTGALTLVSFLQEGQMVEPEVFRNIYELSIIRGTKLELGIWPSLYLVFIDRSILLGRIGWTSDYPSRRVKRRSSRPAE